MQQAQATGDGTITPQPLTVSGTTVADKTADGSTTAAVTPGTLTGLVLSESLGVSATGNFDNANTGTGKTVTVNYTLRNGANGELASNYVVAPNPDNRFTAAIKAALITPINPVTSPATGGGGSRVVIPGFGNSGAATGVLGGGAAAVESREECSDLNPEKCECETTSLPGVEMCFAPTRVISKKD